MDKTDRWLLPQGIEEVLPAQAARLEALRRKLLDIYASWGYELVMPPFIEYLESLLIGTGNDLDLQTFKLTDQLTGRLMGVRADMTPQVARIDAHHLKRETPTRLCYLGTVLHARPDGFAGSRSPLQVGVELYGHSGIESDVEVLILMVETLTATGIEQPYIDLGHVGIFRALAQQAELSAEQEIELFAALQRKAKAEIAELLASWSLNKKVAAMFSALPDLNGNADGLPEARKMLKGASKTVVAALDYLQQVINLAKRRLPNVILHYDLAELRGYHYHTGVVFSAFVPGEGQAIAQGGRYDDIGQVFGRARPATGFSTDLKTLLALTASDAVVPLGIFAPSECDSQLEDKVKALRTQGERIITALPGQQGDTQAMNCDRQLVLRDGQWQVEKI